MKVILTREVPKLGKQSEVREVADGYARNYLFPRGLAIPASQAAQKNLSQTLEQRERHESRKREEQQGVAEKIDSLILRIEGRAGADGRLYGSITSQRLAEALKEQFNLAIDRRKIALEQSIKDLGSYQAQVTLGPGVEATLRIEVVSSDSS